jgi:hypothetical protein
MSIISNLQQLQAAFFDNDLKDGGTSINRIFYELFQGVHWRHNNLTSSNLIRNIRVKRLSEY